MRRLVAALCVATAAPSAFAYNRLTIPGTSFPIFRYDTSSIQYFLNDQVKRGQISTASGSAVTVITQGSDPVAAIQAALATWGSVPGSNIKFRPLKTTPAGRAQSDFQMTITFASAADMSAVGDALAITANASVSSGGALPDGTIVERGSIIDSDIIFSSKVSFSTDGSTENDFQTVMTHELGHALGMGHSSLLGATMFPRSVVGSQALLGQRLLSSDDMAFATAVYGSGAVPLGTIGGRVVLNGAPVKAALITLIDKNSGTTLAALGGADGTWTTKVPLGSYSVLAEPFGSAVEPGDLGLNPADTTTGFQATLLPAEYSVTAGGTAGTPDVAVINGSSPLSNPQWAIGAAGGVAGISSVNRGGSVVVASGQPFDFAIVGPGIDSTVAFQTLGAGLSVRPGSVRVDPLKVGTDNLIRATIDVPTRQAPGLASLVLTKGGNTLAYSGIFVVVPPKPTFSTSSVVSAASFQAGVSPGGISTVFALPNAPNLGPATGLQPSAYDEYGKLPTLLGGVSVTFDGILSPVFYSSGGQLNVQVPFELAGRSTTKVRVNYNGSLSDEISVPVLSSQPAFFGYGTDGTIVVNFDGALNVESVAAARGSVVVFYGTGISTAANYGVETGRAAPGPPGGYSFGSSVCTLNETKSAVVKFVGWTPSAAGLAQWNVEIPADAPVGKSKVKCTDPAGASTPEGTLYIK